MVKGIGMVAAAGIVGVVITKLLWMLMLPLLGMVIGFVALLLKWALIIGLVYLGYRLVQKMMNRPSEA